MLCGGIMALGLWLLGQLFPYQEDTSRETNRDKHVKHKEQ
jgi:hypothetical protein